MPKTRAQLNRKVRQDALRDQLEAQGHIQHVSDIAHKLQDLEQDLDQLQVSRLKAAIDGKKILIDKYLPTLKQTDSTVEANISYTEMSDDELQQRLEYLREQNSGT
jgi:hypothetical protein